MIREESYEYTKACEKESNKLLNKTNNKINGNTSDGYHTFNELYEFRMIYNAALFNEFYMQGKYDVHKSLKHSDGNLCFNGDYFIVVAELPTGQITNHYEMKSWNLFRIPEKECANKFDGHNGNDIIKRLINLYG